MLEGRRFSFEGEDELYGSYDEYGFSDDEDYDECSLEYSERRENENKW